MENLMPFTGTSDQRERVVGNGAAAPTAVQRATLVVVKPTGVFIGIYSDSFDYGSFGRPQIRRASHVEPTDDGRWTADLSPVDGPMLGPFDKRREAIDAELEYLNMMLSESDFSNDQLTP